MDVVEIIMPKYAAKSRQNTPQQLPSCRPDAQIAAFSDGGDTAQVGSQQLAALRRVLPSFLRRTRWGGVSLERTSNIPLAMILILQCLLM